MTVLDGVSEFTKLRQDFDFDWGTGWFDCDAGWVWILRELFERVDSLLYAHSEPAKHFSVTQVKEKFGALRVYWSVQSEKSDLIDRIRKEVERAELASTETCEFCGEPGKFNTRSTWRKTTCDEHNDWWELK